MRHGAVAGALFFVAIFASPAIAIDHKNLDEGRPLRLEDAYPISSGIVETRDVPPVQERQLICEGVTPARICIEQ